MGAAALAVAAGFGHVALGRWRGGARAEASRQALGSSILLLDATVVPVAVPAPGGTARPAAQPAGSAGGSSREVALQEPSQLQELLPLRAPVGSSRRPRAAAGAGAAQDAAAAKEAAAAPRPNAGEILLRALTSPLAAGPTGAVAALAASAGFDEAVAAPGARAEAAGAVGRERLAAPSPSRQMLGEDLSEEGAPGGGGPAWALAAQVERAKKSLVDAGSGVATAVVQGLARAGIPNLLPTTTTFSSTVTTTTETTTTTPAPCGRVEDNTNYPGNDYRFVYQVAGAELCCNECAKDPICLAWAYGKNPGMPSFKVCYLKSRTPRGALTQLLDYDFVAGMPTQVGRFIPVYRAQPGTSLYCFSLVVPWTYEPAMIRMQWELRASIFECDEMAAYSNKEWEVAPGVKTRVVNSNLQCEQGGEFGTALNTAIFMAVWDAVLHDGRFSKHAWTVKVDPDAVFFPNRMRAIVPSHPDLPYGVYLNNCRRGMHGPIEVYSRNAVNAWAAGRNTCVDHFNEACRGDCKWGEDMFIDQCLDKVLHVSRQFESRLLVEDHCDPPPGWQTCTDPSYVSYHPFKTDGTYKECMRNSVQAAMR